MNSSSKAKKNNYKSHRKKPADLLEVFVFCPKLSDLQRQQDFNAALADSAELERQLAVGIVFLNLNSSLQYSRFMNENHVILQAYVPQTAVAGYAHGLCLKNGFLAKEQIHGYFPGWAKGMVYIENPLFKN